MPTTDSVNNTKVTWLTQEAHDRLSKELDELVANKPVIAKEINERRQEGDLRENGGYQAAREEQAKQEGPGRRGADDERHGGSGHGRDRPVRRRRRHRDVLDRLA